MALKKGKIKEPPADKALRYRLLSVAAAWQYNALYLASKVCGGALPLHPVVAVGKMPSLHYVQCCNVALQRPIPTVVALAGDNAKLLLCLIHRALADALREAVFIYSYAGI